MTIIDRWRGLSRNAKALIVIGGILIVALGVTSISGSGSPGSNRENESSEVASDIYDNLPLNYGEIIPAETDCAVLQEIFDIADNAHSGRIDAGDTEGARGFTRTMVAADHRMSEIGCYD